MCLHKGPVLLCYALVSERYISVNFSQVSYSWLLYSNLLATSIFIENRDF